MKNGLGVEWSIAYPIRYDSVSNQGLLKKAASGVPCLRRSGFAQAGRHFSVLTYYAYAPRVKTAAALLDGPFGKTQGMLF